MSKEEAIPVDFSFINAKRHFLNLHVSLVLLRTSENPSAISKINAQLYNWIIIQSNLSRCFLNVHSFVVAVVVVVDVDALNGINITTLIERVSK